MTRTSNAATPHEVRCTHDTGSRGGVAVPGNVTGAVPTAQRGRAPALAPARCLGFAAVVAAVAPGSVADAQCPDASRLAEIQQYEYGDRRWQPILRLLRVPRPWVAATEMENGNGANFVSYWSRVPGHPCPVVLVEHGYMPWEMPMETAGFALLGLDDRGRIVVEEANVTGPLLTADPRLPDVDGDGYPEHLERQRHDIEQDVDLDSVPCLPATPFLVRLVSSRGMPLTDWIPYSGSDVSWDAYVATVRRYARSRGDEARCPAPSHWTLYDPRGAAGASEGAFQGLQVVAARGQWFLHVDRTQQVCTGWYSDPADYESPHCTAAAPMETLRVPLTPSTPTSAPTAPTAPAAQPTR